MAKKENTFNYIKGNILFLILIIMFLIGLSISNHFLSIANINSILIEVSIMGILAVGETVCMLVREIDLSIASLMAFAPVISINIINLIKSNLGVQFIDAGNYVNSGLPYIVILTILLGCIVGAINGIVVVKTKVPSIIATLGMMYILTGFAYVISKGTSYFLTRVPGFKWLGSGTFFKIPVSFLIYVFIGVAALLIFKFTRIGNRIYATGGNENAAIYAGINTGAWKIAAFIFSGFCASIAALIYSSRLEAATPNQGAGLELIAVTVVVIGGTTLQGGKGGILGTMTASLILGIFYNIIISVGLVTWYKTVITGLLVVGAVLLHSRGAITKKRI
jgi:ribose/xylose/arabinose/galactoside ABC-type transport system permease subunit